MDDCWHGKHDYRRLEAQIFHPEDQNDGSEDENYQRRDEIFGSVDGKLDRVNHYRSAVEDCSRRAGEIFEVVEDFYGSRNRRAEFGKVL